MKYPLQSKTSTWLGLMLACVALVACGKKEAATATPEPVAAASESAPVASATETPAHALLFVLPDKKAPADLAQKLAGWKADGTLSDVVLTQYVEHEVKEGYSQAFADFALLDFPSEAAFETFKANSASALGPDVIVSRVDVLLDKRSRKNDPSQSVFVTGVYESLVDKDKYQEFTDDYIDPNMGNQYSSGIMTRYTMYLEREATGGVAKPKAFLVTQYASQDEFKRKDSVKGNYKKLLLGGDYPVWQHIDGTKKELRRDYSEVISKPVPLP
ncbi:hypothetical protein [Pseudoxanthomonas mexicana]|uniref:Lipoprotein n=1 Tax=Pseudoxanthomonas mexicana TaxID=128785 RepID=A0A7G9T9W8_PSEMX|nr:hypothetical protein [Pseudoxanthomonas mexicana]QNN76893.1 hypothetical protein IAE60_13205 [Pseudoxanthomonas mexicana]